MHKIKKIEKWNIVELFKVATILNKCGKDMALKYNLHHWDNTYIKSLAIVIICSIKNDVFIFYEMGQPIATFMTQKKDSYFHFEKLGTLPSASEKGIGSLCMKKIEELAKISRCEKVVMEVYEASQHAISFYEHKGYKRAGVTDTLRYKEIKMEKSI